NKVIAWVISSNSAESACQTVTSAELTNRVTGFLNAMAKSPAGNSQEVVSRGKSLYDLLIKPIKALLEPNSSVFIVPDNVLNYLPFGALVCGESGKYFVEEFLFELAPSSSIMIGCCEQARRKAKVRDERILAVGNPGFDRAMYPLLADLPAAA